MKGRDVMKIVAGSDYSRGAIEIQWCLNKKEEEIVKEYGIEKFFILGVVRSGARERRRFLVPLSQVREFVAFARPGDSTLHLFLVRPDYYSSVKDLKKKLLRREDGEYSFGLRHVFTDKDTLTRTWKNEIPCLVEANTSQVFDVPKEYFAKEPPKWLVYWVTLMLPWQLRDECDLRGRFMYAFTIQPIIVMFRFLLNVLIALVLGVVMGYRRVEWQPIWDLRMSTEDIWDGIRFYDGHLGGYKRSSFWLENSKGKSRPIFLKLFHPIVLMVVLGLALFLGLQRVAVIFGVIFAILLVGYVTALGISVVLKALRRIKVPKAARFFRSWDSKLSAVVETFLERRAEHLKQKQTMATERTMQILSCDLVVEERPKPAPTIKLTLDAFKARICRPYAKK